MSTVANRGVQGEKCRLNLCRSKKSHVGEVSNVAFRGAAIRGASGKRGLLHVCRAARRQVRVYIVAIRGARGERGRLLVYRAERSHVDEVFIIAMTPCLSLSAECT